jgi:AcrR family transcriptional regulator
MPEKRTAPKKRGRPPAHRTPRKEEILETAARLFADEGYNSVSMQDIADVIGLSKTALYHYFDRKEAILGTIVVSTVKELSEHVEQAVAARSSPQDRLVAFMQAQAVFFEKHQASFQVLLTRFANLREPKMRDVAIEWRVNYENTIRNIVHEGVSAGVFHTHSPNAVVRAVISSVYWMARWYRPLGKQTASEIAEEYADIILHGIVK